MLCMVVSVRVRESGNNSPQKTRFKQTKNLFRKTSVTEAAGLRSHAKQLERGGTLMVYTHVRGWGQGLQPSLRVLCVADQGRVAA